MIEDIREFSSLLSSFNDNPRSKHVKVTATSSAGVALNSTRHVNIVSNMQSYQTAKPRAVDITDKGRTTVCVNSVSLIERYVCFSFVESMEASCRHQPSKIILGNGSREDTPRNSLCSYISIIDYVLSQRITILRVFAIPIPEAKRYRRTFFLFPFPVPIQGIPTAVHG